MIFTLIYEHQINKTDNYVSICAVTYFPFTRILNDAVLFGDELYKNHFLVNELIHTRRNLVHAGVDFMVMTTQN